MPATQLDMSQSAVSWKIKRLEQHVGRPLLVRDGHDIRPTLDGRELIADARDIVAVHDRAVARLSTSKLTGLVRFGTNVEMTASNVAELLSRFNVVHPGAKIEIVSNGSFELIRALDRGQLDVATLQVVAAEQRPGDQVLWTDTQKWVTSWAWPFDGDEVPVVGFSPPCACYPDALAALDRAGVAHHTVFTGAATEVVRQAVSAGLGVAILSESLIDDDVVEWRRGNELAPIELAYQVVRAAAGERREVADALVRMLVDDLDERQAS